MGEALKDPVGSATTFTTGGLVDYKDGKFGAGPVANAVGAGGVVDKAAGKVNGLVGKLKDGILGKEDPGTDDQLIDIYTPEQQELLNRTTSQYGNLLSQNENMAKVQGAQMENQIIADAQDQERLARQQVAQRGLGNSSLGLSAVLNSGRKVGEKIAGVRANMSNMQADNLNRVSSGLSGLLGAQSGGKIFKQGQASQGRQGGLAPLIGGAAGAYFGGPAGAQVGMGLGQYATKVG